MLFVQIYLNTSYILKPNPSICKGFKVDSNIKIWNLKSFREFKSWWCPRLYASSSSTHQKVHTLNHKPKSSSHKEYKRPIKVKSIVEQTHESGFNGHVQDLKTTLTNKGLQYSQMSPCIPKNWALFQMLEFDIQVALISWIIWNGLHKYNAQGSNKCSMQSRKTKTLMYICAFMRCQMQCTSMFMDCQEPHAQVHSCEYQVDDAISKIHLPRPTHILWWSPTSTCLQLSTMWKGAWALTSWLMRCPKLPYVKGNFGTK